MKSSFQLFLWAAVLLPLTACAPALVPTPTTAPPPSPTTTPPPSTTGSSVRGVFEGITPCSARAPALPQIPADTDCELMTWKITLHQDSATGMPTTYSLESAYGTSQANTVYPAGGGTAISMEGKWAITKGTNTEPGADVYRLYSEGFQVAVSFVKMDDDILHVLSPDGSLLLGNAAWSYTLNRTDNQAPPILDGPVSSGPEATRPPIPETPPGSNVLGVFEGRMPCHEVTYEVLNIDPFPGCLKLKSRLTLYVDQATGFPSSYMYMGTSTIRQGTWTILEGMQGDPGAIVYQLKLEGAQEPVSFLKADEKHLFLLDRDLDLLVGNALFSYTLSRLEEAPQ